MKTFRIFSIVAMIVSLAACNEKPTLEGGGGGNDIDKPIIEPPAVVYYYADFGNGYTGWADRNSSWQSKIGIGISSVTYDCANVYLRNDNYGSAGRYTNASGGTYARIYADNTDNHLTIKDIRILADDWVDNILGDRINLQLTFGASFLSSEVDLEVSEDGVNWVKLDYNAATTYNEWKQCEVGFTISHPSAFLTIRFKSNENGATRPYSHNIDDIRLTDEGGGQVVDFSAATPDPCPAPYIYPELPSNFRTPQDYSQAVVSGDYAFNTHFTTSVKSGKKLRNYSFCYNTKYHCPFYVAYLLHPVYQEGGQSRTNPDPWHADPTYAESLQHKIYKANDDDQYEYWTNNVLRSSGLSGYWGRGHLLMSRERGGAGKEINIQTFRPSNIAPQAPGNFATLWSYSEALFSGTNKYLDFDITSDAGSPNSNMVSDTLYMVTGCWWEHTDYTEYDSSYNGKISGSKVCTIPTHQWKAAMRTKKGNTGKKVSECKADELQAVAFWFPAMPSSISSSASEELRARAISVKELEEKIGITLFPTIPPEVKNTYNPADWGF